MNIKAKFTAVYDPTINLYRILAEIGAIRYIYGGFGPTKFLSSHSGGAPVKHTLVSQISGKGLLTSRNEVDNFKKDLEKIHGIISVKIYPEKIFLIRKQDVQSSLISSAIIFLAVLLAIVSLSKEEPITSIAIAAFGASVGFATEFLIIIKERLRYV